MAHYTPWKDELNREFHVSRTDIRTGAAASMDLCGIANGCNHSLSGLHNLEVGKDADGYVRAEWEESDINGKTRYYKGLVTPERDALNVVACNDHGAITNLLKRWPTGPGRRFQIVDVRSRTERTPTNVDIEQMSPDDLRTRANRLAALETARAERSRMAAEGTLRIKNKPVKLERF